MLEGRVKTVPEKIIGKTEFYLIAMPPWQRKFYNEHLASLLLDSILRLNYSVKIEYQYCKTA